MPCILNTPGQSLADETKRKRIMYSNRVIQGRYYVTREGKKGLGEWAFFFFFKNRPN